MCVCGVEKCSEMKTQRDIKERRQRQQVVLRALLKEAHRFFCQQIDTCETGSGQSISGCRTRTDIKVKDVADVKVNKQCKKMNMLVFVKLT